MGSVIPPAALAILLPVVAGLFGVFALVVLGERLLHAWRARRADMLRQALAAPPVPAAAPWLRWRIGRLTRAQMRQFDLAGMPEQARAALARALPGRQSAEHLRRCAEGEEACDAWQRVASLYVFTAAPEAADVRYHTLDTALRSGQRHLSAAAMRILLRIDDRRSAELLARGLLDLPTLRTRLAASLDSLTTKWSDLLAPMFRHPESEVRAWGARLAGRAAAKQWAGEIRVLTGDANGVVRRAAVEALGRLGGPSDRDLLLARFIDQVPMVRAHAARAVAALGASHVASPLAVLLADRQWMVRAAAKDALRRIGPAARETLERTLFHQDAFAASSAAEALFGSGLIAIAAREALAHPRDRARAQLMARYFDAGGPLFQNALLEQFTPEDAGRLLEAAAAWREPGAQQAA